MIRRVNSFLALPPLSSESKIVILYIPFFWGTPDKEQVIKLLVPVATFLQDSR